MDSGISQTTSPAYRARLLYGLAAGFILAIPGGFFYDIQALRWVFVALAVVSCFLLFDSGLQRLLAGRSRSKILRIAISLAVTAAVVWAGYSVGRPAVAEQAPLTSATSLPAATSYLNQ